MFHVQMNDTWKYLDTEDINRDQGVFTEIGGISECCPVLC